MNGNIRAFLVILGPITLAACGGGGTTSGDSSPPVTSFSWNSVAPNSTVSLQGVNGIEAGYTYNLNTQRVSGVSNLQTNANATLSVAYDSARNPTSVAIVGTQSSSSWNSANGDTISNLGGLGLPGIDAAVSANQTRIGASGNPYFLGFNYQTFGAWLTGYNTGSGNVGAASVGIATTASNVPTSSSATYRGALGGIYVSSTGDDYLVAADVTANANFASGSVAFSSTNTKGTRTDLGTGFVSLTGLNMTGNLSLASNSNSLTGSLTTTSGLSGTSKGRFYGPSAEELGGTFLLTGSGLAHFGGSFGAVR